MAFFSTQGAIPPTPFYSYNMALLQRTLAACKAAAAPHNYNVHYALKANVEPRILSTIVGAGFGADCVSGWEVQAALEAGFLASDVVFAGVGKSDAEIEYAIGRDIFCFNCESLQEIEIINDLAAKMGKVVRIALRINPAVEPDTHHYIATGGVQSKFGISYSEVSAAIGRLTELRHIVIIGIHFHIGSGIVNFSAFEELALKANRINDWFYEQGVEIKHLNMGGGLGINYLEPDKEPIPDFEGYFGLFGRLLKPRAGQVVHFELGRSLVGQCGELITRVLFTKSIASGDKFIIVDAGMNDLIRPALYSAHHKVVNLCGEGRSMERYYIGGPVCESSDIFAHDIEFPFTLRGDILSIRSAGAYGSIMSSRYNLRPLASSVLF